MVVGGGSALRLAFMVLLNSVQSVSLKLYLGFVAALVTCMSMSMLIGKWSVVAGLESLSVLHMIIASRRFSSQNTLSTLVRFPVLWAQRVGIQGGKAIFML